MFMLLLLVTRLWQVEGMPHPIPDNIIKVFILVVLDEYLQISIHRNSIKHETSCCMLVGWSAQIILHILGDRFFLHDRLVLVLGISCLYLILSWFHDLGCLLWHLPCHFLQWLMGPFLFLESWNFLSKKCWTHTIIFVLHGT